MAEWDPIVPWKCSMQLECVFGCLSLMKCNATFPAVISDTATRRRATDRRSTKVNKRLRTWFFPVGEEPEIGYHPEPDLWGVPNSFFTLNEKWRHGTHRIHQLQSVLIYLCYQWICAKLNKLRISNSFRKVAEGC